LGILNWRPVRLSGRLLEGCVRWPLDPPDERLVELKIENERVPMKTDRRFTTRDARIKLKRLYPEIAPGYTDGCRANGTLK
jgi:hypothetical protein